MRIAIGNDHRGLKLKQFIVKLLAEGGYDYQNLGTDTAGSVDYPDIAKQVAEAVAAGNFDRGILICYTGIGMCIAANKVKGIRAALCRNVQDAQMARQHNDANILCLSGEQEPNSTRKIINTFLTTEFEGGRHQRRLDKIAGMEC